MNEPQNEEQQFWDKCAIEFAAALMTKPQQYDLQSTVDCVYEGFNMAELMLKMRTNRINELNSQAKP